MKKITEKLFEIGVVCFLLVLSGCSDEEVASVPESDPKQKDTEQKDPLKTLLGPLDVYYTLQTSASSTAGTGRTPMKASAIHFFDTYVVVEEPESGGRVFPSDKIIDLSWSGGGRLEPAGGTEGGE